MEGTYKYCCLKKKLDKQKVEKAYNSFIGKFDETKLELANKEVQDLLKVACFTPAESHQFITKIRKELKNRHITLDSIV